MSVSRRTFLTGLIAAPIVVRSGLLMPVKRPWLPTIAILPILYRIHDDDILKYRFEFIENIERLKKPIPEYTFVFEGRNARGWVAASGIDNLPIRLAAHHAAFMHGLGKSGTQALVI